MILYSYNPANNQILGQIETTPLEQIDNIVKKSREAFALWGNLSLQERLFYIQRLYAMIESKKQEFARLITMEMGIPITESIIDIDSGLSHIAWYIDNAENILKPAATYEDETEIDQIIFEPKGIAAVIIAWNYPFSSFVWQAIPNLIAGNTVVIKHSELVPLCSKFIYDIVASVLPPNVYGVIYGKETEGSRLVHQDIDIICFTGSTQTGQSLYQTAGEKFIPVVLECGGSAAGIVFEDADIDSVLDAIYINKFANAGQICDGQKRLIVHENKFDEVCEKLTQYLQKKKIGNPLSATTEIGPLVSPSQLEKLEAQVSDAIQKGAKLLCGGKRIPLDNGNYYEPTLLTTITNDMRVYHEEIFGPVLPIMTFRTFEEAIRIANDTQYGLGGYVYTTNRKIFHKTARMLKTGMVAWNNLYYLKPSNPFGGYKKSGMGKNNGTFGLTQLCNIKVAAYEK